MPTHTHRDWVFTLNNPTGPLEIFDETKMTYLIYQKERSESNTEHYQGFICLKRQQRMSYMKKLIPRAHWEHRHGTREQAMEYCKKEDSRIEDPIEHGVLVKSGHRTDIETAMQLIASGANELSVAEEMPSFWMRNHRALNRYRLLKCKRVVPEDGINVIWLHGPPGTGKSRWVHETYPDAYWKPPESKWFDGYDGEEVIVLDDFRQNWMTFSYLLRLIDRYPFQVETKGGCIPLLATTMVFTTPMPPANCYRTNEDIGQLTRRIKTTIPFGTLQLTVD